MKTISTAIINKGGITVEKNAILLNCTIQPCGTQCTARMFLPYIGSGVGLTVLPREEDEVLLLFPDSNINTGIALWGMYNGVDTVPGGTSENLILVEGRQGDDIQLHVRGNVNIHIDQDQTTQIDGSCTTNISGNNTTFIQSNDTKGVNGTQNLTTTGMATHNANGGYTLEASSSTVTINGGLINLKATTNLTVEATNKLTLKSGDTCMTMTSVGFEFSPAIPSDSLVIPS